ncbi:MAG: 50S ribosomal protein L35 [Candidatus Doudnabacteria bacterium]|nr:50S ribosomal protein L35 [Candidatus Doudnabacteria bacterium]
MPKVKTHKGMSKRIKVSPKGKLLARATGQSHFNSRDSGKVTKNKRRDLVLHKTNNHLKTRIPYK